MWGRETGSVYRLLETVRDRLLETVRKRAVRDCETDC